MNELDVLDAWDPGHETADLGHDHERIARAALDAVIAATDRVAPSPRRRFAGRAVLASAVTAALVVGGVVVARRTLDQSADRVGRVRVGAGALDHAADGGPMNVLVVGSDTRAFVQDPGEASAFGSPTSETGQRADTIILVRIDGDRATGVWLPRDLMAPDGVGGRAQINSFFNTGPASLISAVRALTGEPVDHYVQVDFASFMRVVDDLGGVRLYVPAPVRDLYSGLDVATPGCREFDGNDALAWVRSRHAQYLVDGHWVDASPRADLDRIVRQQQFLHAIGAQTRARVGDDVGTARRVLDRVFPSLTVDAGMRRDTVESFVAALVRSGRFDTVTAPNGPDDLEAGRLRLLERPAGEDFFTWATQPTPATRAPTGGGDAPPAAGASC